MRLVDLFPLERLPRPLVGRLVAQTGVDAALALSDYLRLDANDLRHAERCDAAPRGAMPYFAVSVRHGQQVGGGGAVTKAAR